MIVLTQITDTIELVLDGAHTTNPHRCFASFRDITASAYTPGRNPVDSNGVTPVVLVPAPAASTQRVVDWISVYNDDTTNKTVTVRFDDNGTKTILTKVVLGPGERLEYVDGHGWRQMANNGAIKQTYSSGNNPSSNVMNRVILGNDVTNNNAVANTIADIPGLSFPVTAGKTYKFCFIIDYTAAATTTGSRFSVSGPGSPTRLSYRSQYSLTTTSETVNSGLTAYDLPAASNASSAATGGNTAIVEGQISPSANGTVIARFASEVASSAIVAKAGSYVEWQEVL